MRPQRVRDVGDVLDDGQRAGLDHGIAQQPLPERTASRLMVVERATGIGPV